MQVMHTLHDLAVNKNIITICTVHQPRSRIWNLFDDVMIMSPGGRVVYHGRREDALNYFNSLGYPCPANTNPAEFLIDLVSIDSTSARSVNESWDRVVRLADAFDSHHHKLHKPDNNGGKVRIRDDGAVPSKHLSSLKGWRQILSRMKRSVTRTALLLRRSFFQTIRDSKVNIVRLGTSALLATVISSVYGKQGPHIKPKSISNRVNIIAQAVINVAMLSMIKTLQLFKKERVVVDRERHQNQYTSLEYLLAKSSAELPLDAIVAAVS